MVDIVFRWLPPVFSGGLKWAPPALYPVTRVRSAYARPVRHVADDTLNGVVTHPELIVQRKVPLNLAESAMGHRQGPVKLRQIAPSPS